MAFFCGRSARQVSLVDARGKDDQSLAVAFAGFVPAAVAGYEIEVRLVSLTKNVLARSYIWRNSLHIGDCKLRQRTINVNNFDLVANMQAFQVPKCSLMRLARMPGNHGISFIPWQSTAFVPRYIQQITRCSHVALRIKPNGLHFGAQAKFWYAQYGWRAHWRRCFASSLRMRWRSSNWRLRSVKRWLQFPYAKPNRTNRNDNERAFSP